MEYLIVLIVFLVIPIAQSRPVENSRMPLLNNLRAPLVAELDITNLNNELKGYIDMNVYDQVNQTFHAKIETVVDDTISELKSDILEKFDGKFAGFQQRIETNFTIMEESLKTKLKHNLNLELQKEANQLKELKQNLTTEMNQLNIELRKDHKQLISYLQNLQIIEKPFPHKLVDCSDLIGVTPKSGVYLINPGESLEFKTYCDMETDGGGWTVFQRRFNGQTDFYRDWNDYKEGFGYPHTEFWMGNAKLSQMTSQRPYELRINLEDYSGATAFAKYSSFSIGDESTKYKLAISGYYGTAGDNMDYHNNQAFSTKDSDNDQSTENCATKQKGAWWYRSCANTSLNGLYGNTGSDTSMWWWSGKIKTQKTTSMMIRRKRT